MAVEPQFNTAYLERSYLGADASGGFGVFPKQSPDRMTQKGTCFLVAPEPDIAETEYWHRATSTKILMQTQC